MSLAECVSLDTRVAPVGCLGCPFACTIENLVVLDVELAVIEGFSAPVTNMWQHEPPTRPIKPHINNRYIGGVNRWCWAVLDRYTFWQSDSPEDFRLC